MGDAPTFITFVRHAQSLSNQARRWEGHGDSALSDHGQEQARLLGERLRGERITHVLASDLTRAVDTACSIGLKFETHEALREIDVGRWHGLTSEELRARYPDELEAIQKGEDLPRGGGETAADVAARVSHVLDALLARLAPGDHAVVVCHGGVIATAVTGLLGLSASAEHWALANAASTSITRLAWSSAGTELHVFNDALHLRALGDWPLQLDTPGRIGLVCDSPGDGFGAFAASYDALGRFGEDAPHATRATALSARLAELYDRHPAERIALTAQATCIQAWTTHTLWRGNPGTSAVVAPSAASISHVVRFRERMMLVDYGVSARPVA